MTPTARLTATAVCLCALSSTPIAQAHAPDDADPATIAQNDNTRAAGASAGGVTRVRLVADIGTGQPEGPRSPRLRVAAFGETARLPTTPGPLLRVVEDTEVSVEVENRLPVALTLHGLMTRPAKSDALVVIPAGATREIRFNAGAPGTWTLTGRRRRTGRSICAQASTASLAAPSSSIRRAAVPPDRVFVIGEWDDRQRLRRRHAATRRPARLRHQRALVAAHRAAVVRGGAPVRWRWLNGSYLPPHPMHLHGFHFDVRGQGNGLDAHGLRLGAHAQRSFTQNLPIGATLDMAWVPERAGNWLFHCHIVGHISPALSFLERSRRQITRITRCTTRPRA